MQSVSVSPLQNGSALVLFHKLTSKERSCTGRNIIFADGAQNLDLAVIKRTQFGKEHNGKAVEFRAKFFNLLNHPQFGPPDLDFLKE